MSSDQRRERQIQKYRDDEARWLQKVLFSLGKARETREKLAAAKADDLNPLITLDDGKQIPLDTLEEIIQKRVAFLMEALGRTIRGPRG